LIAFGALAGAVAITPLAVEALVQSTLDGLADAFRGAVPSAGALALRVGTIALPPLGAAAVGAMVLGMTQTGGVLSSKPVAWNLARINPFARGTQGFTLRLVSLLIGFGAALATLVAAWSCWHDDGAALAASVGDADVSLELAARTCRALAGWALAVSLLAGAVDGVYRHAAWRSRNRMTRDEVRQEQRENQGDPALRRARELMHRELARGGAMADMTHASLLVLGAPRWAVALRYDPGRDVAPRVILRGVGASASTLQALAVSHFVPIEHDAVLAEALASVPLDEEVPKQHYADVAQALRRAGLFRPEA
jgi:flagellar biosynthetic protein FlhB